LILFCASSLENFLTSPSLPLIYAPFVPLRLGLRCLPAKSTSPFWFDGVVQSDRIFCKFPPSRIPIFVPHALKCCSFASRFPALEPFIVSIYLLLSPRWCIFSGFFWFPPALILNRFPSFVRIFPNFTLSVYFPPRMFSTPVVCSGPFIRLPLTPTVGRFPKSLGVLEAISPPSLVVHHFGTVRLSFARLMSYSGRRRRANSFDLGFSGPSFFSLAQFWALPDLLNFYSQELSINLFRPLC